MLLTSSIKFRFRYFLFAFVLLAGNVLQAQTISDFNPKTGPVGTLVTITGTGLSNPTGISIGGVAAIPISNNGTTLVAMVMPGAATGGVSVTAGGTANGTTNFITISSSVPGIQQGNKLVATSTNGSFQYQGRAVSISADGNTAIIGGYGNDNSKGAAWIWNRSGTNWTEGEKLIGNTVLGSMAAQQGVSVAMSSDGKFVLVGGNFDNDEKGAVWVFEQLVGGGWIQRAKLVGTTVSTTVQQGISVALSADGTTALIGGWRDNADRGAAWIFTRSGSIWTEKQRLFVDPPVSSKSEKGRSVALSADGKTAIIGGPADASNVGAAWVWTLGGGGTWTLQQKLVGTGASGQAQQGVSVSISADGNTAIVGGNTDDGNKGASWIYTRSGGVWTQQGDKLVGTGANGVALQGSSVSLSADGNTAIIGGQRDDSFVGAVWVWTRSGSTWSEKSKIVGTGANGTARQGSSVAVSADGNTAIVGGWGDASNKGAAWVIIPVPPPSIASFTPTAAGAGTQITITGTNLTGTSAVSLGGTSVASFTVVSATTISAVVGTGSTGALSLVTPGGTATLAGFTFIAAPTIANFSPNTGPVGTLVTITGTGLSNPTGISIGGVAAIPISNNGTTLVAMVMPGAATGGVSVTTAGGTTPGAGNFVTISSSVPNTQQGNRLKAGSSSRFGYSVSISADGNTAIIGGFADNNNTGAAWIYIRSGDAWTQQGNKLVGTGAVGSARQGWSVSISADGNTAIVGGYSDNNNAGAAWIYTRSGGVWTQQGDKLVGTGAVFQARRGWSVSISADGNTAIVGGIQDNSFAGAAWVFTRSSLGNWTQQGNKLVGTGAVGSAEQGQSVSISADGNTAIVGGNVDNGGTGATWIYTRSNGVWTQQGDKLVGTGATGFAQQGCSVSISADGNTAIVGGFGDNSNAGAAWIHTRSGGVWTQQGNKLVGTGAVGTSISLGSSVAISADGNTAIVGGSGDNNSTGAAWLYTRNGGVWTQQGSKLVGEISGAGPIQGQSVSISANGNTAIIGGDGGSSPNLSNLSNGAWVFIAVPPPSITSFTPTSAGAGAQITITGTNLTGTSAISLGGTAVASFTVLSSTTITAVVGSGSTGALSLVTPGGTATLAGFSFIPPPTISSFTPTSAGAGAQITIIGTNLTGASSITLGGTAVASFTVLSSTTIIAVVGSGSTGAMTLITPGGAATRSGFTFISLPPTIASFTPTSAGTGAQITIIGTNLTGASSITLGGTAVASFTVLSSTTITAVVGSGSTGALSLVTSGGTATLAGFTFIAAPTIVSFVPTSSGAGAQITITGTNLTGTSAISLGGTAVASFTVLSSTTITAVVGSGSTGALSLVTPGGTATLAGFTFIAAPTISSFTPTSAGAGAQITIIGTNLTGASSITLGGTAVASFTVLSSTTIIAVVGSGSTGAMTLITPGGAATRTGFTFISLPPTIASFTPTSAGTGAQITITGTNLLGTTAITLGGTSVASFTVVSSTTIIAAVGTGSTGALSLVTPGGTATLAGFTYILVPTISSFAPNTGPVGTLVTITGANLSNPTGINIGGVAAIPISNNGTTLVAMVMPGATTGGVSVTAANGTANGSGNFVTIPSSIINIQQGSKLVGSGTVGNASQGWSVSISADGNTAIVGGYKDDGNKGAAWIYTRSGGVWTQQSNKLVGTGALGSARQGYSVSISADGNTAIVGGDLDDSGEGAVWVYTRSNGVWTQQGNKLVGTGAVTKSGQGNSVSISADGNTAIVGGPSARNQVGGAWIFTRVGDSWLQQGEILMGSGTSRPAAQGQSVSISADGNTAIVGGFYDNGNAGAAWIYTRSGGVWTQQGSKLVGTGATGKAAQGSSVSMSADGNTAIVGGYLDNNSAGAAWIYTRSGGVWTQQGSKLVGTDGSNIAYQGNSVSISADGNTAIVGGDGANNLTGAAWIYKRSGGVWTQQGNKLVGTGATGKARQGWNLSISADGNTAIIGAFADNSNAGAAWVFIPAQPPSITSFTPTAAGAGSQITITGTNLTGTTAITLGGTSVASFTVVSSTTIRAVVASGSTGALSLVTPGGTATLTGFSFIGAPTISSFNPTSAGTGSQITITGTNFIGTSSITLGGTAVTSFTVVSSTTIVAIVGTGSTGALSLITPYGSSSRTGFTYFPFPTITSFTPTSAGAGTQITITGTNLTGTSAITLGGTAVASFTVLSSTMIRAVVAAGGSTGALSLVNPAGTATLQGFSFILPEPPTINNYVPNTGPVGTLITITGTNLSNPTGINIGGVAAIPISNNGTTLVAMLMPGAATGGVSVTTAGGTANGTGNFVTIPSSIINIQQGSKLVGTGATGNAQQGYSVSISADGNTAIVGGHADNSSAGAAWIYTRSGGEWTQQGNKLVGTGALGSARQGYSVSISADGNTAIVGGYSDNSSTGAAWIYTRSGGVWTQQGNKLVGTGAVGSAQQGESVSISADGNTAIVGGSRDNNNAGAAWVYTRSGGVWTQQGNKLVGTGANAFAQQGFAVSLSADGNTAIIGGVNGGGAAWVFTRNGSTWTQQGSKLVGTGAIGNAVQGASVALSADGNTAIVGGYGDNSALGAAWVFTRSGSTWTQQGNKLVGTGNLGNSLQGLSVSLSADGNTAIIGGNADNFNKGAAWVFTRSGGTWTQQGNKLVGTASSLSRLGYSISLSADANTAIVGGPFDNGNKGAAWVFIPAPPPSITSFTPTAAGTGEMITITGTNLTGTSAITLGGASVSSFTVVSSTTILAVVGSGASGALSLVTQGGTATQGGFNFNFSTPAISTINPSSAGAGTMITITGTNLTGTSGITLGGTTVSSFTVVSSTTIIAVVGSGSTGALSLVTPAGTATLPGFSFIAVPTITGFTPTSAGTGEMITITGTNFTGTSAITLGGASVASFTVLSSTTIIAVVGSGLPGALSLVTPGGTATQGGFNFNFLPPTISSFSPSSAGTGTPITITGTNFIGVFSVTIGGTPVNSFTTYSPTTIGAVVGSGTLSGSVGVITPGGGTISQGGFNLIPIPSITFFEPRDAGTGEMITITGTDFTGTTAITLGGVSVASFTVLSSTTIIAVVGNGLPGALSLVTPGGTATLGGFNFIFAPPTISGFSPSSAGAGTPITITGTNFIGVFSVTIGGTPVNSFTTYSPTTIGAIVGSGTLSGAVNIITPGGGTSSPGDFTLIPPPTILDFQPTAAGTGELITITGINLNGTTEITLGGATVSSFTVVSSTTVVAIVGSGQDGSLHLVTPGGSDVLTGFNFIYSPPTISSFTPSSAGAGTPITITGTNFIGVFSVTIGGSPVNSFTTLSPTTISAIVGSGSSSGSVGISTPGGSTTSQGGFTVIPAPTISGFQPTSAGVGAQITITGTNLAGTSGITIGGTSVSSFTIVSSTTIVAIVGSGSTGSLSLVTPGGSTTSQGGFTLIPAPTIGGFQPTSAAAGAQITITGTNFSGTSGITIGGTSVASFTIVSSTTIVAIVGSGSTGALSLVTPGGTVTLGGFTFISAPTISTAGNPSAVNTIYGIASASTSFTLNGVNLSGNINISSPQPFEISTNSSGDFSSNVSFTPTSGTVSNAIVFVRLRATANVGTYSGSIVCSSIGAINQQVSMAPSTVTPSPLTITAGNATKTYGSIANITQFTSTGLRNNDAISGATLTSSGSVATAGVGNYSIIPSNATGTGLSNYAIVYNNGTLTVLPASLTITASNQAKCQGVALTLPANGYVVNGLVNGDAVSSVNLTSTGAGSGSSAGSFNIVASGATGNGLSNYTINYINGTLTVNPLPAVTASSNFPSISKGKSVTLVATGTGSFSWSPAAEMSTPNSSSTNVRVIATTTYTVTLTASTGCVNAASVTVEAIEDLFVDPPPVFTPNGDGINDRFVIKNLDLYPQNKLQVFDRTGKVLYEQVNYSNNWDGTINGKLLTKDTYFFVLTVRGQIVKRGTITIVR